MSIVLYNASHSTNSQKVRIALHEKSLPFEEKRLDLFKGEQTTPEYLAINPNGLVPALIIDGQVVVDSAAIIEFLNEKYPEPPLAPTDPIARAHMREWMRLFEQVVAPAIRTATYNQVFLRHYQQMTDAEFLEHANAKPLRRDFLLSIGKSGLANDQVQKSVSQLEFIVSRIGDVLADGRDYLVGSYSLADISVLPALIRMYDLGFQSKWHNDENFRLWYERCLSRASVQQALYTGSRLSDTFGGTVPSVPDNDC